MSKIETESVFGLSNEQYWTEPLGQKSTRQFSSTLLGTEADGMFIDAPKTVFQNEHSSIPLLAARAGDKAKIHKYSFETTTKLIVIQLETGIVQVVQAAPSPAMPSPQGSPGWTVRKLELDLARTVDLGAQLGRYATWMICGPQASNKRLFSLYPSPNAEGSAEVKSQLDHLRKFGGPPHPLLVNKQFGFVASPLKSADEQNPIWKISQYKGDKGIHRIEIEFRLMGLPRFVYPKDKIHLDENGKQVFANLPILLVGFNEDRSMVIMEKLGLPVLSPLSGDAEKPVMSGKVSLEVNALIQSKLAPKTLSIWAIVLNHSSLVEFENR